MNFKKTLLNSGFKVLILVTEWVHGEHNCRGALRHIAGHLLYTFTLFEQKYIYMKFL